MNLTDEELEELECLAEHFFSLEEMSIVLEIDSNNLFLEMQNKNSIIFKTIYRGRLKSEFEVRKVIVRQAKQGSPAAQAATLKMINESKLVHTR